MSASLDDGRLDAIRDDFERAWRRGNGAPDPAACVAEVTGEKRSSLIAELVCVDLEYRWKPGSGVSRDGRYHVEDYLRRFPDDAFAEPLLLRMLAVEYRFRAQAGEALSVESYRRRFPALSSELERVLAEADPFRTVRPQSDRAPEAMDSADLRSRSISTGAPMKERIARSETNGDAETLPEHIGRYRVDAILGRGSYGWVYRGWDADLERVVAIKVPRRELVSRPEDLAAYLAEARTLAQLDHPRIVPVHDVGRTDDGLCYVVSKFVEGSDLAKLAKSRRLSLAEALTLAAHVADALGHAHARGLVHRDVKPANILIDASGLPVLADFGLALREREFGSGAQLAGTPAYMSPEQARGEGHRVDARSDLFSLGVVLFELLAGRRPFEGTTVSVLLDRIATADAPSPRQFEPGLPAEAERICRKALSRRASDRYATAAEFADDLRHLAAGPPRAESVPARADRSAPANRETSAGAGTPAAPRVVPKGLRSFDAGDADFFLDLLPGPRDRNGLPESLRFWKSRIEANDPEQTFSVGLIYGPSGCGKSSLVKAGLIPRLDAGVRTVYVEATPDDTEVRLCRGLRNLLLPAGAARDTLPAVTPDEAGPELVRMLGGLRRGTPGGTATTGRRVYLSSSYQDLAGHRASVQQALRTAAFDCSAMEQYAAADQRPLDACLADVRRCDLYVGLFAHRYGFVPPGSDASITELEYREARRNGIPTLIFLVDPQAPWPDELRETGAGSTRLKELRGELERDRMVSYFGGPEDLAVKVTAAAARWLQERAAPAVAASGGQKTLIVLDQFEQWLAAHHDLSASPLVAALRQCDGRHVQAVVMIRDDFYMPVTRFFEQLDVPLQAEKNQSAIDLFDIPHARNVLTAFGQAYGRLDSPPSAPQGAFLDQVSEGLADEGKVISVRLALFAEMLRSRPWTEATLREIGGVAGVGTTFLEETFAAKSAPAACRRHAAAARSVLGALLPEDGAAIKGHRRSEAELRTLSGYAVRPHDFADLLRLLDSELRLITPGEDDTAGIAEAADPGGGKHYQLTHDYLVPSLRDWLTRKQRETRRGRAELLLSERAAAWNAKPLNRHLPAWHEDIRVRAFTNNSTRTEPQRRMMRASGLYHATRWGLALAVSFVLGFVAQRYESNRRAEIAQQTRENNQKRAVALADALFTAHPLVVPITIENLKPLRELAVPILQERFADWSKPLDQRLHAAMGLAAFGQVETSFLADGIATASNGECRNIVAALSVARDSALPLLQERFAATDATKGATEKASVQRARLAIVALHLGEPKAAIDLCRIAEDPTPRRMFETTLPIWNAGLKELSEQATQADDGPLRAAVCLGLGWMETDGLPDVERQAATQFLLASFQHATDSGTHGAADWALRHWHVDAPKLADATQPSDKRNWYVNSAGMTMLKLPAGKFRMGSENVFEAKPVDVTLTRPFYLADREVSEGQFQQFLDDPKTPAGEKPDKWKDVVRIVGPTAAHPVQGVNWYDAVLYCNWLSRREGRTPAYERTGEKEKVIDGEYDAWRRNPDADGYRLPTEAEWEYACRAGTTTAFSYGDNVDVLQWYAVFSASSAAPCGSRLPNDWGLCDLHGSVWEWCGDCYDGTLLGGSDPDRSNSEHANRVLRGGSWLYDAAFTQSANRYSSDAGSRYFQYGFRPSRTP